MASGSSDALTDEEILENAGETTLDDVLELTLRGRKPPLSTFEPYCAKLPNIKALSLSHNQIATLAGFSHLQSLSTLNLNNNALATLDGIQHCRCLQQAFLAGNLVRDLQPLHGLPLLRTLHLLRNNVSGLDAAVIVLRSLPALRDVELMGNPCSVVPEYKHRLVVELPALESLDGDAIAALDRELAAEHFGLDPAAADFAAGASTGGPGQAAEILVIEEEAGGAPTAAAAASAAGPASGSTADADPTRSSSGRRASGSGRPPMAPTATAGQGPPPTPPHPNLLGSAGADRLSSPLLQPRPGTATRPGTAQLFRDDAVACLNDNPILLEYLAKHVLQEGLELVQQGVHGGRAKFGSSSFVSRLRGTALAMSTSEGLSTTELAASGVDVLTASEDRQAAIKELVTQSTPQELLRQLIKLCEVLVKEVEASRAQRPGSSGPGRPGTASRLGTAQARPPSAPAAASTSQPGSASTSTARPASGGSTPSVSNGGQGAAGGSGQGSDGGEEVTALRAEVDSLRRELKSLQLENQNMYWLAEEYKRLKKLVGGTEEPQQ